MAEAATTRQFHSTAPVFLVADVQASAAYYRDVLGFRYERLWGDPPCFCMPERDGFVFMLSQVKDPAAVRPNSAVDGETWDAYAWIRDADALFSEYKSKDVTIVYAPEVREAYGMKEFAIKDLDGYIIAFGQDWPPK